LENYEDSVKCLERIYKNFNTLGAITDQFPYTQLIIRENREILSQAHLETIYENFPNYEGYEKSNLAYNKKAKQAKIYWSEDEQKLFLEGIERYGYKSKIKCIDIISNRFKKGI
jgi:hypothetical protein